MEANWLFNNDFYFNQVYFGISACYKFELRRRKSAGKSAGTHTFLKSAGSHFPGPFLPGSRSLGGSSARLPESSNLVPFGAPTLYLGKCVSRMFGTIRCPILLPLVIRLVARYRWNLNWCSCKFAPFNFNFLLGVEVKGKVLSVCSWPVLLKNPLIWMGEFSYENRITLNLIYKLDSEFNSGAVRTVRDKSDPLRVLGSIERLKFRWFWSVENFSVSEQYRTKTVTDTIKLNR